MNNLKESKAFYIVLSILIAIGFWFYVVNEVSTETRDTIRNIPVVIVGEDELLEKNLLVTGQSLEDIDLKIEGSRKSLMKLTRENITVTVDVSNIPSAGEHEVRCSISLPNTISASSVTIKNRDNRVKLTVEDQIKKTVEVKGNFTGTLATGYEAEEFILSPAGLEITGPASLIDTVDHARVNLSGSGLTETFTGMLAVEFIDVQGNKVSVDAVNCSVTEVYAVYPVVMVKDVPISVAFIPGGGATEENVNYKMTPEMLRISGPGKEVSALSELMLGEIDLAEVATAERFKFEVSLPDTVKCLNGEPKVIVTVALEGLASKALEVTQMKLANVPDGYEAIVLTERVKATVRGEESAVEAITAEQITAIADVSAFTEEGIYKAAVSFRLDGVSDAGVLDEGKTVSVQLKKLGE